MKLNAVKFGLALGLVWGVSAALLALFASFLGWGTGMVEVLSSLYIGYAPSTLGAAIGLVWGFIDAFVGGFIVIWLYNRLIG